MGNKAKMGRKHRRRAKARMRDDRAVRSHSRPRPRGRKVRVKHF